MFQLTSFSAQLAQSIEHEILNPLVVGSSLEMGVLPFLPPLGCDQYADFTSSVF